MTRIRVEAIPTQVAARIRADRSDGHGNTDLRPIHVDEHPGYICRHCLEDPAIGESVYLLSYSPFEAAHPYRTLGPIFIHATTCRRYGRRDEIPRSLRHRLLSFRGYRSDGSLATAEVAAGVEAEAVLECFFGDSGVAFVDIHNARPGCFNCRVYRD